MMNNRFIEELLLCDSPVSKVYGCEFDRTFNVRSELFKTDFITKAYASEMTVNSVGEICFKVKWRDGQCRNIGQPFHLLRNGILFAMKLNKHRKSDSFALNHELFALDWESCVILHFLDGEPYLFMASREEWMVSGIPGRQSEELQVFMQVPDYRCMKETMIPADGKNWLSECVKYKRNR